MTQMPQKEYVVETMPKLRSAQVQSHPLQEVWAAAFDIHFTEIPSV